MLTGKPLFADKDPDETLKRVREAEIPPPSDINGEVPEVLDKICLRALERDPDDRYQSATKFLRPLSRYLYTNDSVIGPAELSKLVAESCPPSNREIIVEDQTAAASNATDDGAKHLGGTVVMEHAAGKKRRKPSDAVQTFATNAVWREELREAGAQTVPDGSTPPPASVTPDVTAELQRVSLPPTPARVWTTRLAVIAALGFAVLALLLWRSQRSGAQASNSEIADAAPLEPADALPLVTPDASEPVPIDAAIEIDAKPAPDARPKRKRDAGQKRPAGNGTLKIGAQPWANVTIDGVRVGQAPGVFRVSAGSHRVVLEYKGEQKPFVVEVADGEVRNLSYSFASIMP